MRGRKPTGDEHPAPWYVSGLLVWGCDARMCRTNRPSPLVSRNPVMSSAVIRGMMYGLGGETGVHSPLVTCVSPHEAIVYTVCIRRAFTGWNTRSRRCPFLDLQHFPSEELLNNLQCFPRSATLRAIPVCNFVCQQVCSSRYAGSLSKF